MVSAEKINTGKHNHRSPVVMFFKNGMDAGYAFLDKSDKMACYVAEYDVT